MEKQKFKRGNLVEILFGHAVFGFKDGKNTTTDISPEQVGKQAIIEYSYAEKYGGGDIDSYSVVFVDTGNSLAWKQTNEMKFISEGGEHLFKEAKQKRDKIEKQETDFEYINSIIDEGNLSSTSILTLFKMLGFKTSFHSNGEFYILYADWSSLHPVFLHIKHSKTLKEAESVFKPKRLQSYNVEKVFNEFKALEK